MMVLLLGYYFNIKILNFPEKLEGICQQNMIFNHKLPYWNIKGMEFPVKASRLCISSLKCGEIPETSPTLANTWDGYSWMIGEEFRYFCDMGGLRSRY